MIFVTVFFINFHKEKKMLKKNAIWFVTFSVEILYRTIGVRFGLNGSRSGDFCHESAITTILKATTDWEFNTNAKAACGAAKGNTANYSNHLHEVGKIQREKRGGCPIGLLHDSARP